jgi:hypothetical protein
MAGKAGKYMSIANGAKAERRARTTRSAGVTPPACDRSGVALGTWEIGAVACGCAVDTMPFHVVVKK